MDTDADRPYRSSAMRAGTGLLARSRNDSHARCMFCVDGITAAFIRRTYEEEGELSAPVTLRRFFPGIADDASARHRARVISGWEPAPVAGAGEGERLCRPEPGLSGETGRR